MAKILAAGDDGSFSDFKILIASTDSGITWAKVTTALSDSGWAIHWDEDIGLWICGTDDGGTTEQVQTSPDGDDGDWTAQSSPADGSGSVRRIISGPGKLVAIFAKSSVGHIMTSTDSGVTWVEQFLPDGTLTTDAAIAYSPDLGLYAVGEVNGITPTPGNNGACATSPDAITWTIRPKTSNMGRVGGMAWGNGTFVLMGGPQGSGEHLYVSTDGVTWTRILSDPGGTAQSWAGVTFANGIFVAVSDDLSTDPGNQAVYGINGTTWTKVATPGSKNWKAVAYDGAAWIACDGGFGSTQPLMRSTDNGLTWSLITLGFSYGFMNGIASDFLPSPPVVTMGNIWAGGSGQGAGNHW